MEENYVFMTVLSNEKYIAGVKALKKSLERVKSKYKLAILVPEEEKKELIEVLIKKHILNNDCFVCSQPQLKVEIPPECRFNDHHYWENTFFKLRVANCTEFSKIVMLDSDMLILKNIDHLFDSPHYTAVNHPSINKEWVKLNSGLMVICPSNNFHTTLINNIIPTIRKRYEEKRRTSDQDVFQETFSDWENHKELILPEKYNAFYEDIYKLSKKQKYDRDDFYVVHFIGESKPFTRNWKENTRILLSKLKRGKFWSFYIYLRYLIYCI